MAKFGSFLVLMLVTTMADAYLEEHGPRDRFWRHNQEEKALIVDGKNHYEDLEKCIQNALTDAEMAAIKNDKAANRRISQTHIDPYRGWTMLVNIEQAIAPSHAKAIQTLASCVREIIPGSYESRSMSVEMGFQNDVGLGGNCPTHLAPLVQMWFPEVFYEMQRTLELAYEAAGWSAFLPEKGYEYMATLPDPKDVGFRATEHLTYNDFKEGLEPHTDGSDTKYTFNYAFSDDYTGGYYYIIYNNYKNRLYLKPKKYDAMIFLGGVYEHGVTEITSGVREMFSNEIWALPDAPFGTNLWSNVQARMKKYIEACNAESGGDNTASCKVDFRSIQVEESEMYVKDFADEDEEEEDNWDVPSGSAAYFNTDRSSRESSSSTSGGNGGVEFLEGIESQACTTSAS